MAFIRHQQFVELRLHFRLNLSLFLFQQAVSHLIEEWTEFYQCVELQVRFLLNLHIILMNPFLQTLYLAFQAIFMRLQFIDGSFRILIIGYQKIVATSLCLFKRPLFCPQIVKVGKLYFHVLPFPVKCHEVVSASFLRQFLQGFNLCIVQIVVWVLCVGGILQGNHVSNHILLVNGLAAQ